MRVKPALYSSYVYFCLFIYSEISCVNLICFVSRLGFITISNIAHEIISYIPRITSISVLVSIFDVSSIISSLTSNGLILMSLSLSLSLKKFHNMVNSGVNMMSLQFFTYLSCLIFFDVM